MYDDHTQTTSMEDSSSVKNFSDGKIFIKKWIRKIISGFKDGFSLEPAYEGVKFRGTRKKPFSLRIATFLNFLNYPLFWSGILLFLWLSADYFLGYALPADLYHIIQAQSKPLVALLGPAAVGYWTNWLAIKMLFHPRRNNAVWWGLIHARREDLIESISEGILSSLISPEIVHDYLHEQGVLKELSKSLSRSVEGVIQEEEFREELRLLLFNLLNNIVNNRKTRELVDQFVSKTIQDWTGQSLSEKMMEWTKQIWGAVVRKQVIEFLPDLPKAIDFVFPHVEVMLQSLPVKIEEEGRAMEPLVARAITDGLRSLNLKEVIRGQLGKMDAADLEKLLTSNISGELVFIQTSGGIFGFLVGLAILFPSFRLLFVAGGLLVGGIYRLSVEK